MANPKHLEILKKGSAEWNGENISTPIDIYTVPVGKRLVITDVIISGCGGLHSIFRDNTIVFRHHLSPTYSHSYVSGIEFQENQIVGIRPHSLNCTSDWELRGQQTDIN